MCSSKSRLHQGSNVPATIAKINGRPVLQPKSNQVPSLEKRNSLKKNPPKSPNLQPLPTPNPCLPPPISPKQKSPRPPELKRGGGSESNSLSSSDEKFLTPRNTTQVSSIVKISKKSITSTAAPGSIAAARREHVANMQEQRKLRVSHYGRLRSAKQEAKVVSVDSSAVITTIVREERRCSFITPSSDPIYVAYHNEEWGVPVHDDKLLFELLVLTGAQVGSDWTSVLKKRQEFREAFHEFDAEVVAKFNEKKITSISAEYGINISQVRGVLDNANRILLVKKEFGTFDKYLWGFVTHKAITTQYKSCNKIPVKTSKSETISKDMLKRGFRFVGPTIIHSFMQAAGLSNDHLITCPRHLQIHSIP